MTTQTVHIHTFDYGASLTSATLRTVSADTLVATADSVDEVTADSGLYAAVFGETAVIAAGEYRLRAVVGGQPINRYVTLAGTDGEVVEARNERAAVLDSDAQAMVTAFNSMRSGNVFTEEALANAPSGGGSGLTGPFTRTITVTDAADDSPIEAAKVRLYRTGETETKPTEADGHVEFTTEAATFSYAVTANGYGGASGTIVISANGATTIELTANSVTPPTNPDLSAIEVLCLDEDFEAASGIDVDFRMASVASGDQNRAHPGAKKTVTSNGSGIARFEGPQGATIEWKRGTGQQWTPVTLDNDSVTNVTSVIGSP